MAQPRHNQCWLVFTHADFASLYSSLGLLCHHFTIWSLNSSKQCMHVVVFFSHLKKIMGLIKYCKEDGEIVFCPKPCGTHRPLSSESCAMFFVQVDDQSQSDSSVNLY